MPLLFIFFIEFCVVVQLVHADSPYLNCKRVDDTLDCSDVHFQHGWNIDPHFLWTVKKLVLRDNFLNEIHYEDAWGYFSSLECLHIESNQLSFIHEDAFKGLKKLTELNLANSQLNEFPAKQIKYLKKLKKLNLTKNNLSGKIQSSTFSNDAFLNLEELDLSYNNYDELVGIPFINMKKLKLLDLSSTKLTSVKKDNFKGLLRLKTLKLNGLTLFNRLQEDVFQYTPSLQHLEIQMSHLLNISLNTVKGLPLRNLRLGMNPLICDCHVEWIWNELHHKSRDWDSDILTNDNKNLPLQCIDLKTKQGHDLSELEEGFCEHQLPTISSLSKNDFKWSDWTTWSSCNRVTCHQLRNRSCTSVICSKTISINLKLCDGKSLERKRCYTGECIRFGMLNNEDSPIRHAIIKSLEKIIDDAFEKRNDKAVLILSVLILLLLFFICVSMCVLLVRKRRRKKKKKLTPVLTYKSRSQSICDKALASTKEFLKNNKWFSGKEAEDMPPMPFLSKNNKTQKDFFFHDGKYVKRRQKDDLPPPPPPPVATQSTPNHYELSELSMSTDVHTETETHYEQIRHSEDDAQDSSPKKKVHFSEDAPQAEYDEDLYLRPSDICGKNK
ncbi:uncharacterized protein LOC130635673 [Hydractinia symbiolongicarpus]|uniref:uncharacterized protein LOC130635673 n=1 Tax=Hydractinia symbiolongicarpus TaxID=13093 RepID=UPI0025519720|nr:uncharacterized protein LOC130635673 [Hydractinia symbiolongicarpus]